MPEDISPIMIAARQLTANVNVNSKEHKKYAIWQTFMNAMGGSSYKNLIFTFAAIVCTAGGYCLYLLYLHHRATMACKDALCSRKLLAFEGLQREIDRINQAVNANPNRDLGSNLTSRERIQKILLQIKQHPCLSVTFKPSEILLAIELPRNANLLNSQEDALLHWRQIKREARALITDHFKGESGIDQLSVQELKALTCYMNGEGDLEGEMRDKLDKITTHSHFQMILQKPKLQSCFTIEQRALFKAFDRFQKNFNARLYPKLKKAVKTVEENIGNHSLGQKSIEDAHQMMHTPHLSHFKAVLGPNTAEYAEMPDDNGEIGPNEIPLLSQASLDFHRSCNFFTTFMKHRMEGSLEMVKIQRSPGDFSAESGNALLQQFRSLFSHQNGFDRTLNQNIQFWWSQKNIDWATQTAMLSLIDFNGDLMCGNDYISQQEFHDFEGEDRIVHKTAFTISIIHLDGESDIPPTIGKLHLNYQFVHQRQKDGSWKIEGPYHERPRLEFNTYKSFFSNWTSS